VTIRGWSSFVVGAPAAGVSAWSLPVAGALLAAPSPRYEVAYDTIPED